MINIRRVPILTGTGDQLVHNDKRLIPNDKLSRMSFRCPFLKNKKREEMGKERYEELLKERELDFDVLEATTKKHGAIITTAHIELSDGYEDTKPLNQFDKEVLIACMCDQQYGNKTTTINAIYRNLIGSDESYIKANPHMRKRILESIKRLIGHIITIDMSKTCKKMGYKLEDYPNGTITSSILPAMLCEGGMVNGKFTKDIIKFDRPSPLFVVAQAKHQIITYAKCILRVPDISNTEQNIIVKNYVLEYVMGCRAHPRKTIKDIDVGMHPTIVLNKLYKYCDIPPTDRKKTKKARQVLENMMKHLVSLEIINSYEFFKENKDKKTQYTHMRFTF